MTQRIMSVVLTALVIVGALWFAHARYQECRRHGHPWWYCIGR